MPDPLGPLTLLLALSTPQAAESPDRHVDEAFGFEITRPSTDWMFVPKPEDRKVELHVVLTEPEPLARLTVRAHRETNPSDPMGLREAKWGMLEREVQYSDLEKVDREIAGRTAPGLSLVAESKGVRYRVRQFFLVEAGRRFELEDVVVERAVGELDGRVDAIWETFGVIEVAGMYASEALLHDLASRCGSEVKLAKDWEDASARAREEGKLVAVAVHLLRGFDQENPWPGTSFMDPDLIDLFNERYVPVMFEWGWDAPFEDQGSYGMGPASFGRTLLLVTPDGEVVDEWWQPLDGFLRKNLARMPGPEPPSKLGADAVPLDRAEEAIRRGEFTRARVLLEDATSARGHLLRAEIHRREYDAEAWGESLRSARRAKDAGEHSLDIDLEQAKHHLSAGRTDAGKKICFRLVEEHPDAPHAHEAAWLLGLIDQQQLDNEAAKKRWMRLVEDHPESRWAWKAAHTLLSQAFATGLSSPLAWPDQALVDSLLHPEAEPIGLGRFEAAREETIDFLLETQYADGSWITPMEVGYSRDVYTKHLTEAVTAICARALLPVRDRPEVRRSLRRATDHLILQLEDDLSRDLPVLYMDYAVWNRASQVYFFAECCRLRFGNRERLEGALAGALQDLRDRQHERGGWSYFISGEIGGSDNPITQSISFTTAYVILALAEARSAGIELPEGLAEDALGCLERMRNDNDTFVYMLMHADEQARRHTTWESAAGRGPLCSLALLRHERGSLDEVRSNLDEFVKHRGGLTKQVGRALMHAGPHAEGSHWVLFDFATASEAVTALPGQERARYGELLLADILATRRADGSYLDDLKLGRAMGAAMALWAFENLGGGDGGE